MIRWQHRMTNKRVVEKAEINEISCKMRRRRWNWLGHVLRREGAKDHLEKDCRKRKRQGEVEEMECGLGSGTRQGGWADHVTALCPTGPTSDDDDDDDTHRK